MHCLHKVGEEIPEIDSSLVTGIAPDHLHNLHIHQRYKSCSKYPYCMDTSICTQCFTWALNYSHTWPVAEVHMHTYMQAIFISVQSFTQKHIPTALH